MEQEWTGKVPLVPEWSDQKDSRKEQTEQMPKLSLKLLYGMIQEMQQYSERINARLDEFEHYLLEVQIARAQLEASAAKTIAKAKAIAEVHEQAVRSGAFAEAAAAMPSAAADEAPAAGESSGLAVAVAAMLGEAVGEAPAADADGASAVAAVAMPGAAAGQAPAADAYEEAGATSAAMSETTAVGQAPTIDDAGATEAAVSAAMPSAAAGDMPAADASGMFIEAAASADAFSVPAQDEPAAAGLPAVIDAAPAGEETALLHAKPGKRESQPDYLMSLAMEVLGFPNDEPAAEHHGDGIDSGEGANPFDPDVFSPFQDDGYMQQTQQVSAMAATANTSAAMSSPFFTPRSQRHPAPKKTLLSLFGFRTRIS